MNGNHYNILEEKRQSQGKVKQFGLKIVLISHSCSHTNAPLPLFESIYKEGEKIEHLSYVWLFNEHYRKASNVLIWKYDSDKES